MKYMGWDSWQLYWARPSHIDGIIDLMHREAEQAGQE